MTGGCKRIVEPDLDVAPAQDSAVGEVVGDAILMTRGALHQQARLEVVALRQPGGRVVHAGLVGRGAAAGHRGSATAAPQVADRAPGDPHEEEIEDGEKT